MRVLLLLLPFCLLLPSLPQAVLVKSEAMPEDAPTVRGWDFSQGCDLDGIMAAMLTSGFQATALGQAVIEVNRMVRSPEA